MDVQDKREFLLSLIQQKEKMYEKKKFKRTLITFLCFSIVFFFIFYFNFEIEGWDILYTILFSLFCGFIYFYINLIIFCILYKNSLKENSEIEQLKYEYNKLINKENIKEE